MASRGRQCLEPIPRLSRLSRMLTFARSRLVLRNTTPGKPSLWQPFAHIWPTLRPSAARRLAPPACGSAATIAPVLARCFCGLLGGNWGYPDVHDIGNSGKDG